MSRFHASLVRLASGAAARRFAAAAQDPAAAQRERLRSILRGNANTEYGREHDFDAIRDPEGWRARVPIVDYEVLRDRMDRVLRGEEGVLTAEKPLMFARTSGTTGEAKFIPVTRSCRGRVHQDPMRTWFWHAMTPHPALFRGRLMTLVSPAEEGRTAAGVPYGSTSGHIYKNLPQLVKRTYLLPYELFELDSYEARYYVAMRMGVACPDVTFLATANPSSILKLVETADRQAERMIRDVADGGVSVEIDLPLWFRNRFEKSLRPDRQRAAALNAMREARGGRLLPADYWPHLTLIGCWKAGTVGSYLGRFPAWFDRKDYAVPVRDWGYLSSEARGSIPLRDEGAGGVLSVANNYYEFAPVEDVEGNPDHSSEWNILEAHELEIGREYYVFLTTTGGLYRYDINDIVECTGRWSNTPEIVFRRKGRGMTSLTGEKISVNQIIEAFQSAAEALSIEIDHFKAEADPRRALYVFQVESRTGVEESRRMNLLAAIDRELGEQNIEYSEKRKSGRLSPPVLQVMRPGWYEESKRRLVKEGRRLFQAKTILLSTRNAVPREDPVIAEIQLHD